MTIYRRIVDKSISPEFRKLQRQYKDCKKCALFKTRNLVIHYRGNIPCDIVFLGEAPGESEDILGIPFIGPAGKKLDEALTELLADITFRFAITNIVSCIPLDEDNRIRSPTAKEAKACRPRLNRFLALAKPKLIVTMGKIAQSFLPEQYKDYAVGVKHPSAILRAHSARQPLELQRFVLTVKSAIEKRVV